MQNNISIKIITRSAISIALGFLLSMIKLFNLPFGGSATLCSMLFIALPGYMFGCEIGIIAGIISGIINFIFAPVFLHPIQFFLDYILAFASLGFAGIFNGQKNSLLKGYIFCVFLRFICAFISGIVFFKTYAPENLPVILYSFIYNFSYIAVEACISIILIYIPVFKNVIEYLR
jgi:putative proton-coupled thiamine transporter YuaJ